MDAVRVVISGCSGGGKSTLLAALAARGHVTVEEPGRRVVRAALAGQGGALPWEDGAGFAAACIALAAQDWERVAAAPGPVFFDRSALDAAIWLNGTGLPLPAGAEAVLARRFSHVVLAPPWPDCASRMPSGRARWPRRWPSTRAWRRAIRRAAMPWRCCRS